MNRRALNAKKLLIKPAAPENKFKATYIKITKLPVVNHLFAGLAMYEVLSKTVKSLANNLSRKFDPQA